jgi:hypothetical protein
MAVGNFIPDMWEAPLLAMYERNQPVLEAFAREQRERMEAQGYELVDVSAEWLAARDAFWEKFEALIADGEREEFIRWVQDEGYEKTTNTREWVKKESK